MRRIAFDLGRCVYIWTVIGRRIDVSISAVGVATQIMMGVVEADSPEEAHRKAGELFTLKYPSGYSLTIGASQLTLAEADNVAALSLAHYRGVTEGGDQAWLNFISLIADEKG